MNISLVTFIFQTEVLQEFCMSSDSALTKSVVQKLLE